MGDTTPVSRVAFVAGGGFFDVRGVPVARNAAVLELGADANVTHNLTLGLQYSGQLGGGVRDHAVMCNLFYRF